MPPMRDMTNNVARVDRAARSSLRGHGSLVIWFTGISGSGKTTLAAALERELHAQGTATYLLDGDEFRSTVSRDLSFSESDRMENIRRAAEVARVLMNAGVVVLATFISPMRSNRSLARELIGADDFVEVFVDTPLNIAERRDAKGLYALARRGEVKNFTAVSSPYEPPLAPDVHIETMHLDVLQAMACIRTEIERRLHSRPAS